MNIQDLKSNTTWQEASNTINNNNNKISLAIATLEKAKLKNKGYFTTVEKLNEAIPNPTIGSKAYVGTSEPYAIYIVENGAWVNSGYTGGDEIVAKITTDRIEDGAVTIEKIATSAFDSTLSVSGKIAPADVVGEKITELNFDINGVKTITSLDTLINKDYNNKSVDCYFVIGKKYKVVINTDNSCTISIRYNLTEATGPAIIHDFNNNIGETDFVWECNTDKAKDKLYFVPKSGSYPVHLTATLYEYKENAIIERIESVENKVESVEGRVESVKERTIKLEKALIDLRNVIGEVDFIERETNCFLTNLGSIRRNKYTSNYVVTVYYLEKGKKYKLIIKDYTLVSAEGGIFGFRDVPTIEIADNIVQNVVGYSNEPITEKIIDGEGQYLFTGDIVSSSNLTLYELSDIDKSVSELIEEGLAPLSEIKEALVPMSELYKADGVATPNWFLNSGQKKLQNNQYTSPYKVTQYELKANTRYLIKVINPNLLTSSVGMFGFHNEGGLTNNKILVGIVSYKSTEETEFVVVFDETTYLFTCDNASLTNNNFIVYEFGNLQPIDVYVESKIQDITGEIKKEFDNLADLVVPTIKIQIPDVVYASVGTELNFYNDGITLSIDRGLVSPMNYHTQWSCNFGRVHSRGIVFNPTSGDIGNHTCTCDIYTLSGKLIDSKTFTIKVVNPSMSAVKNILFVGDSLGTSTYNQIVSNFNNAEKYGASIKPNLYNFSKGGWHWRSYATEGVTYQRVEVTGIGSLSVGAKYVDSANNLFEILEVNITEGNGNVLISKLYSPPYGYADLTIPSGSLTKANTSYGGDTSFSYTNGVNEAGNPFWNASKGALDIAKFRSDRCISDKIDMVIFQLGINSNNNINTEGLAEGWITDIYNAFLADNPNTIFVLGCTPTATNDYSAIGSNYGVDSRTWGIRYATNEYKFKDLYLRWGQDANGHPNMRVIGEHLNIDRWYGYPMATRQVNANTTATEEYHTNYVHPSMVGYKQIADAIFASIIGLAE